MVDKILCFHLYVYDDINYLNNMAYKFHIECLKHYSHVFNKACFNISVENIENREIIQQVKKDLIDCNFNNIEIITTINDAYCEVNTFKYFVLDRLETLNSLVFFGHTKGLMNVIDGINYPENILHWIYTMYYFNLEDFIVNDMIKRLIFSYSGIKNTFYGTLRTFVDNFKKSFYPGTFYWINPMKLYEDIKNRKIIIPKICNRNFCEELPYVYENEANAYNGLACYLNKEVSDIYLYNDNDWNFISTHLNGGENEYYNYLYNKLREKI